VCGRENPHRINNEYADTVTVIPVTSATETVYPFEITLPAGEGER